MNSLLCNITLLSLKAFHYSPSPIFASFRSNLLFKDFIIDRSFSTFSYDNRYIKLKKSKFSNFLNAVISVNNDINISGYFPYELDLNGIGGTIKIVDSLFHGTKNHAVIQSNDDSTSIFLLNSQFVDIPTGDNAIDLKQGASLFVNSVCFFNLTSIKSLLNIKGDMSNMVQLNYTTIYSTKSRNSLIDCTDCSFDIHNVNFSSNEQQSGSFMVFSNINYFSIIFLNSMNSISQTGFLFTNHIDLANFTMINVNNLGKGNEKTFIFYLEKGSIYVYYSSFNIRPDTKLIYVNSSTAFFYKCNSSALYNYNTYSRMIWSIYCSEKVSSNKLLPANPDFFVPLIYCKDGSHPNLSVTSTLSATIREKILEREQLKGATEILGILLISVSAACIVAISLWLILYFVAFKNKLREFDDDDQMAKWKQRWNWILANSNKNTLKHRECSDMELDPIELSDDAVKRRHKDLYDNGIQDQFSESQKLINDDFIDSYKKKSKKRKKKEKKLDENDEIGKSRQKKVDESKLNSSVADDVDMKSESHKSKKDDIDDAHKLKNNSKSVMFNNVPINNPKKEAGNEDDSSKKKNDIKRTKSLKIHFLSSDEDEKTNEEEEGKSEIISESDDLAADNDKINDDLKKTKSTWNRFQKTGIDKTLGAIDQSSDSSWGFKHKKFNLSKPAPKEEDFDSSNIWSDEIEDKKKKKSKKDKDDDDDDYYDDDDDYDIDDDDDDDIWSDEGDDKGDDDDYSSNFD